MRKRLESASIFLIDLLDPYLQVSTGYLTALRQKENAFLSKASFGIPLIFLFIYLNALLFNDSGKTNYQDWFRYRIAAIAICIVFAMAGYLLRRTNLRLKFSLVLFAVMTVGTFAYGMTLGYPFRSQWMSYFAAPIFAIAVRSAFLGAFGLAGALFAFRPIWGHYHETRLVMTEYEFTCLFILLSFFWRKLWISKVTAEIDLRLAETNAARHQQELHNQLRTFIAPVLVKRIENLHRSGSSIADAMDSVLRLRSVQIAVLYSDLRDYSRRSDDRDFVEQTLIPSAAKILDLTESNEAVSRVIADGIFCFYANSDPEESLLRAVRDAWICAETECFHAKNRGSPPQFSRYFTVTFGEASMGNIGSKLHKDTTVIGRPANLAARIDQMTKNESVQKWIADRPHVLLSAGGADALKSISENFHIEDLDLAQFNLAIRSYENERQLYLMEMSDENAIVLGKLLALNNLPQLRRGINLW